MTSSTVVTSLDVNSKLAPGTITIEFSPVKIKNIKYI